MAQDLLSHKLESIRAITRAEAEVRGALAKAKGGIVELKRFAPWKQYLIPSRAKFVVYPSQRGGYCAQGVPPVSYTHLRAHETGRNLVCRLLLEKKKNKKPKKKKRKTNR